MIRIPKVRRPPIDSTVAPISFVHTTCPSLFYNAMNTPPTAGDRRLILRMHHAQITIPTGAEAQAREFYCSVLGLKELKKPEQLAGRGGFWLDLNDLQLHIGIENDVERSATKAHIAYEVTDLNAARISLENEGISILPGVPIPGYNRFEFRDPFGNRLEFLQRTPIID